MGRMGSMSALMMGRMMRVMKMGRSTRMGVEKRMGGANKVYPPAHNMGSGIYHSQEGGAWSLTVTVMDTITPHLTLSMFKGRKSGNNQNHPSHLAHLHSHSPKNLPLFNLI